ncbi:MAG TPA: FAD:protein FMN transferase [Chloroflexota bacterium]|nr:FAD:protein FMN transferase [Chloroflexota bacterium]
MLQIEFRAFGSAIRALIDAEDGGAAAVLAEVPVWFEHWEGRLSRFRPESELSRLNGRPGRWIRASSTLWEVARCARWAARVSGGLVVPHVLGDLLRAGYDRSFGALDALDACERPAAGDEPRSAREATRAAVADRARRRGPRLRHRGRRIRVSPGWELDLAGVAKAWAGQQAAARLAGYGPALVDAGGDIAVTAPPRGSVGWPIGLDLPGGAREIVLGCGGVATSGTDFRRWRRGNAVSHHIIDPRTAEPARTDISAATVVAPTLLQADVSAKAVLILGSRDGPSWLAGRPHYGALLALGDGSVVTIPASVPVSGRGAR